MAVKAYLRLGDILLKERLITDAQLQQAVQIQKDSGKRLGEVLIDLHHVTDVQLAEVLGRQLGLPYRSFSKGEMVQPNDPSFKKSLPEEVIRKELVLPLKRDQDLLTVALADPLDLLLMDNLRKMSGCKIAPVIATKSDLAEAIEAAYGKRDLLKEVVAGTYSKPSRTPVSSLNQVEILEEGK
ncbi:MAG: type II secretion system protein GspE, partial [Candidatus Omnitrophica bacterium]|nr:type II secretion system protein GspE [Candidatus Omnitrophota bacterium]